MYEVEEASVSSSLLPPRSCPSSSNFFLLSLLLPRNNSIGNVFYADQDLLLIFYFSFRFTINRTHCVNPLSRVFFICPNTVTILTRLKTSQSSPQYENLWLVGKQGFEGCEVNKSIDKKLIDCNNPLNLLYYEVIFKRYSAVMSAPVFEPGREYYFIGKITQ